MIEVGISTAMMLTTENGRTCSVKWHFGTDNQALCTQLQALPM